jgi:hypothetical protein
MLLAGRFDECKELLEEMPVGRLSNAQLLTVLTATLAARDKLNPSRAGLVDRIKSTLAARGAEADQLLSGLE